LLEAIAREHDLDVDNVVTDAVIEDAEDNDVIADADQRDSGETSDTLD